MTHRTFAGPAPEGSIVPPDLAVLGSDIDVTVADGSTMHYANLDYAASAPCLRSVANTVAELLPYYASVHRGAGSLSQMCTARYEQARESVAAFLGCRNDDEVIFTRNSTDSLNLLARAVPAETTVLTYAGEHHANLLPWTQTVRLSCPGSPQEAVHNAQAALRRLARRSCTPLLLAVTGASNVTGEVWPIAQLAAVAHFQGARIAVDAAQLAPHRAIDIAALDVDYIAISGHKLYAPFGAGVLAGRRDWLDTAAPYLAGGGATTHVGAELDDIGWASGPPRHEAGTPNVLGAVALATACNSLAASDRARIQAEESALLLRLLRGLSTLRSVRHLHSAGPWPEQVGIVAFTVDGIDAATVAARLADEYGIGVRDGKFCAHQFTTALLHHVAAPTTTAVRASIGLGTTTEHVDRLIHGLRAIASTP